MIKILGNYGSKDKNKNPVTFLIDDKILIDAGNLMTHYEEIKKINHIFISHTHFDHICDLAFFIEKNFNERKNPLKIYASNETINTLKNNIFNNKIWPDFEKLSNNYTQMLKYIEIKPNEIINIENISIKPISLNHTIPTLGFIINNDTFICLDTYKSDLLSNEINKIKNLFIEVSYPNRLKNLAKIAKHLTPMLLEEILNNIKLKNLFIFHLKPEYEEEIKEELKKTFDNYIIVEENDIFDYKNNVYKKAKHYEKDLLKIINLIAFNQNTNQILDTLLQTTMDLTDSDGATIYIKENNSLKFNIIKNKTLNTYLKLHEINWSSIPLEIDSKPNREMVAAVCANENKIINLTDVYLNKEYNFEGTKKFDKANNYRSKSMLVIPLKNHENEVIGVLQLINKKLGNKIIPFNKEDEKTISLLGGIAAVLLTKNKLIQDLEEMFDSFVKTLANALDQKDQTTSNHIKQVAILSKLIAETLDLDKEKIKLVETAGWLHDIGKIITPDYLINKSTKLQKIYDGIEFIKLKFEIYKKELKIKLLENKISQSEYDKLIKLSDDDIKFLEELNKGNEWISDEMLQKLEKIKNITINNQPILEDYEYKALSIRKGTLLPEEFEEIKAHVKHTYEILKTIKFPNKYKDIIHIASNHHEKLNGKGYPLGLTKENLTLEDRILAIADIFEALSSNKRAYKKPMKFSQIFDILYKMAKDNDIDKNIIKEMIKHNLHIKYANKYLNKDQIDEIPKEIIDYFLN